MRKFFLLLFFVNFIIVANIHAQQDTSVNKNKYEIALGFCKPLGSYRYIATGDNTAYAQNGVSFFVAAKSEINSFLGFKYSAAVLVNPAHNSIFAKTLLPESALSVKNWVNSIFGLGTFFYSEGETSTFEIGLNVGLMTVNRPKISHNVYTLGVVTGGDYYKKGLGFGLAIYPEIAFCQKLSGGKSLKLFANYVFAPAYVDYKKQHFFIVAHPTWDEYIWTVETFSDRLKVSVANIGVGLVF